MDLTNGKIYGIPEDEDEKFSLLEQLQKEGKFVEFDIENITQKQFEEMQVSLKDHKSILGKKLTAGRNNSCPCGSGKKFKKCCLHKQ